MRRTLIALTLTVPLLATTIALSSASTITEPEVVAGSLASLTGSASQYGISQARGASLAAAQSGTDGSPRARLILADDQSNNDMGRNQMIAFAGTRVGAVIGPTLSGVAALADPVAVASGIPVLAVTNTTLDITAAGPTVWRICLGENQMIPASVTYARTTKGVRTAALVSVTGDAYSEGAAAQFRTTAAAQGIALVADVSMPQGSSTAPSVLATAEAAEPQAIFFAARDSDATNLLEASSDFTGVKVGGNGYNTPTVITASGATANGLIVSASWNPAKRDAASRAFVTAYARRYPGDQADAFAAQAYAGVQVLREAVAMGNGTSARAVQRGLVRMSSAKTVLGTIRFPGSSHEATYPATVQQVSGGVLKLAPAAG